MRTRRDFEKVVPIFEQKLQSHIGYWTKMESGQFALDFYRFGGTVRRFILQYVFRFQRELIRDSLDENGVLHILCEDVVSGRHSPKDSDEKFQEDSSLKDVILDEIHSVASTTVTVIDSQEQDKLLVTFDQQFFENN